MRKNERIILESCNIVQSLITKSYEKNPDSVIFKQHGLLNGLEIVTDYVRHNEMEIALEHFLYMINESDIILPIEIKEDLSEILKKYGFTGLETKKVE